MKLVKFNIGPTFCTKLVVFGVSKSNGVIHTLVAMVTKNC